MHSLKVQGAWYVLTIFIWKTYVKIIAQTKLQGLRTQLDFFLRQIHLCHQQVGLCVRRAALQTMLQVVVRGLSVTWGGEQHQ